MNSWKLPLFRRYEQAVKQGLPIFNGNDRNSSPLNAAPYLTGCAHFLNQCGNWPGRSDLVCSLKICLEEAKSAQLVVDALLVGGSFLDMTNSNPADVDCVWLYRSLAGQGDDVCLLQSLQTRFKKRGVDMRFIPIDVDVLLFAKTLAFFAILYTNRKANGGAVCAPVLLDCAN
jgi:hypothetical protein